MKSSVIILKILLIYKSLIFSTNSYAIPIELKNKSLLATMLRGFMICLKFKSFSTIVLSF